jgi:hypothetical protein
MSLKTIIEDTVKENSQMNSSGKRQVQKKEVKVEYLGVPNKPILNKKY